MTATLKSDFHTLCVSQKVVHQTHELMAITLSILNGFSKFFHSIVSDGLVNAMPKMQKRLLHFTTLVYIKIACYLERIFNRNRKLKQQVST